MASSGIYRDFVGGFSALVVEGPSGNLERPSAARRGGSPFGVDAGDPWLPSLPWIPGGRVGFRMWLASTGSRAEVANFCFPPALPSKFADFIRISGVPLPCLEASTRRSRPGYSYADGFDISWPERPLGAVTTCVARPPCDNSGRRVLPLG